MFFYGPIAIGVGSKLPKTSDKDYLENHLLLQYLNFI